MNFVRGSRGPEASPKGWALRGAGTACQARKGPKGPGFGFRVSGHFGPLQQVGMYTAPAACPQIPIAALIKRGAGV